MFFKVTPDSMAEWGSKQAHLNEVGNFLLESTDPQTSRSLAEELRRLNMQWAEFFKRNAFVSDRSRKTWLVRIIKSKAVSSVPFVLVTLWCQAVSDIIVLQAVIKEGVAFVHDGRLKRAFAFQMCCLLISVVPLHVSTADNSFDKACTILPSIHISLPWQGALFYYNNGLVASLFICCQVGRTFVINVSHL